MKKIGIIAVASVLLISCGAASDGKANTDTTNFAAPMQDTGHTNMGVSTDSNNRIPPGTGVSGSSSSSRSTTSGSQHKDSAKQ